MNKLKVAVIMSIYRNDELDNIRESVSSMLSQSHLETYLFIYIDGPISKNVYSYLENIDINNRIEIIFGNENSGLAVGLNILIDEILTQGNFDFIARMDSDDISRIHRIQRQVVFLSENSDIDLCGTSCREFGASFALKEKHLPKTHDELFVFSISRCPFIHPSVMFRTSVFHSGVRYPVNTALTEDMALWFTLLDMGYRFANINEVLLDYRLDENTIQRRKGFSKALSEIKIRLKYMHILNLFSVKNLFLICSRLAFHLLPDNVMKLAYKKAR